MLGDRKEKALRKLRKDLRSGLYSYLVLLLLEREGGELHGYAIRKRLDELSGGRLVPSEGGALYDILKGLRKLGLVRDEWAEVGGGGRGSTTRSPNSEGRSWGGNSGGEVRTIELVLDRLGGV